MSPALLAYRWLTALAEPWLPTLLRRRARRGREDPARLDERLGREPGERPAGRLVWLHGASVGEGLSLLPLVQALRAAAPDATLLATSGTVTAATLLGDRLPPGVLHRYAPLDGLGVARRFVARWRPDLAVFAESEVWPNLLAAVGHAGGRTALVSARLGRSSLNGWARVPGAACEVFGGYALVLAQDDAAAAVLRRLGARDDGRLNLKLGGAVLPVDAAVLKAAHAAAGGRPVLLAASTHSGEEALVLDAFATLASREQAPRLVLAPRHPERGAEVAAAAASRGLRVSRQGAGEAFGPAPVHVADALGELGLWYRLAASVAVGGGWAAGVGGHNPVEPARLGAPLLAGPGRANWREVYAALGDAAPLVADAAALAAAWTADLDHPAAARARAARADVRLAREDGAVAEAARRLAALLPPAGA